MAKARDRVQIQVHRNFFDNIFEPNRKKLEKQLGIPVSQTKFTNYLAKGNMQMDMSFFNNKKKRFKFNVRI